MPHPSKDLSDLAGQFFKPEGADLSDAGQASRFVRDTITHFEERTRPYVASVFWQAFLATPSFAFFMDEVRRHHPHARIKLLQVVPHGPEYSQETRFDLLVLLDGVADPDLYIAGDAQPLDDELKDGSKRFLGSLAQQNM